MPPMRKKPVFKGKSKVSAESAFVFKLNGDANEPYCAFCSAHHDKEEKGWGELKCHTTTREDCDTPDVFLFCPRCSLHDAAVKFIKNNSSARILLETDGISNGILRHMWAYNPSEN